jgi:hypothetical protein
MNKATKTIVATTVAFGTLLGLGNASGVTTQNNVAHAATTPYYTYHGYAGNDPSFLLSKEFKNGLKYNNVTFNGVKLAQNEGQDSIKKYDQEFYSISKDKKTSAAVHFDVKGTLTEKQLKSAYGSHLAIMGDKDVKKSLCIYSPNKGGGETVQFGVVDGKVTDVTIGYTGGV